MKISRKLSAAARLRELSAEELVLGKRIFETNLRYKSGESILIIADAGCVETEAAIWFEAAKTLPHVGKIELLVLEGMTRSGEEPPAEVITACESADISLLHTIFSLTHTAAGKAVMRSSNRGFSLPGVNLDLMRRTLNMDYEPVRDLGQKLKTALEQSPTLHITSPAGTEISVGVRQDNVMVDVGFVEPGEIGNLPAGEVFFAPLDGTANGTWVVDGSMADFEKTGLDAPIKIDIKDGYAVAIAGGESARQLDAMLAAVGPDAYHVAEIGIGINPNANPHGDLIEAEKAYATAHLALGNSSAIGGSVNVPIHLDGVSVGVEIRGSKSAIISDSNFVV